MSSAKQPKKHFDTVTYTGNGGTQSINSLDFSPDLVWIKSRTDESGHCLQDTIRGTGGRLLSNTNTAESASVDYVTSFDSNGFTIGSGSGVNTNSQNYVAWCWNAGDETVTNNDGTIESQVRASQEAGFSVVTYTGVANGQVGHGLGAVPKMIIAKSRTASKIWIAYHEDLGINKYLILNSTDAALESSNVWGSAAPTSSVFNLENSSTSGNVEGDIVAYCWSEVPGFSSFGTYVGNGSADGPMVNCGFKPRFVIIKRAEATGAWNMFDSARSEFNPSGHLLNANVSDSEYTQSPYIDFLSNGFKSRTTDSGKSTLNHNETGATYVYMAFADTPTFAKAAQVLDLSDNANLPAFHVGTEVTTPSGGTSEVVSNDGEDLEVSYNAADPFLASESVSASGTGSGTIKSINKTNNTITLDNVDEFFVAGRYGVGSTARHGAMAVSDEASSVLEAAEGYSVVNSVTFDSTQSQYLSRTPSSAGNRKTWTWSGWVKRNVLGTYQNILGTDSSIGLYFQFEPGNQLRVLDYTDSVSNYDLRPAQVFTDTSAWTHIVLTVDTTHSTADDRIKLYIDGTQVTDFTTRSNPTQDYQGAVNSAVTHTLGRLDNQYYCDLQLAEVHFIDGEAMGPENFGYEVAGWWLPKAWNGYHGKNGFYLGMRDGIGTDESGNGNDWTLNGLVNSVSYLESSTITSVDNSGGVKGANPEGLDAYYGVLTAECKNLDGSLTTKNFKVPNSPLLAINGDASPGNRAEADSGFGIDIIIPDGIGSSGTGASVYGSTSSGVMIAVNGDFANGAEYTTFPENSGWFDLSGSSAFQRDGKLYRVTLYNSEGTAGNLAIRGVSGTTSGGSIFSTGSYGTATGHVVAGVNSTLTFEDNTNLADFNVGDAVQENISLSQEIVDGVSALNPENVVDGFQSTYTTQPTVDGTCRYRWTLDEPIPFTKLEFVISTGSPGTTGNDLLVNGSNANNYFETSLTTSPQTFDFSSIPSPLVSWDLIKQSLSSYGDKFRLHGIKVDGVFIKELTNIISVDVDNNQMVVDGGKWDTSNRSEVWSNNLSSPHVDGVTHPERAFDGIISDSNYAYNSTFGESLVWTTDGISAGSHTYKVYYDSGSPLTLAYTVGGVETVVGTTSISDSFTATNVQSIKVTGSISGPLISAIEVDGKILVDKYDDSEVWSDGMTGNPYSGPWSRVFDGTWGADPNGQLPAVGTYGTFTPATPIVTNKLILRYYEQESVGNVTDPGNDRKVFVTIDGSETMLPDISDTMSGGQSQWVTVFDGAQDKTVTSIRWGCYDGADYIRMDAIQTDKGILIDTGVRYLGATQAIRQAVIGDSTVDVPTSSGADTGLGGEVRGNYATWNPLDGSGITIQNGNLGTSRSVVSWASCKADIGAHSGKYYFEYTVNSGTANQMVGVYKTDVKLPNASTTGFMSSTASGWAYQTDGNLSNSNNFTSTGISSSAGDVIMVAFDVDAGKVWFGRNGTWFSSGDPATGTNASYSNLSGRISPATSMYGTQSASVNFGAKPFAHQAPAGYLCLVDTNL